MQHLVTYLEAVIMIVPRAQEPEQRNLILTSECQR